MNVMNMSGLFKEYELRVATCVYYLQFPGEDRSAGDLLVFADGPDAPAVRHRACFNTAVMSNNNHIMHVICPKRGDEKKMPEWLIEEMDRSFGSLNKDNIAREFHWRENPGRWAIEIDGREVASFPEEDVRISVQLKIGCFRDEADVARFLDHTDDIPFTLDQVLEKLVNDLRKRGLIDPEQPPPRSPTAQDPDLKTLQDLLLDTYLPLPSAELVYRHYMGIE